MSKYELFSRLAELQKTENKTESVNKEIIQIVLELKKEKLSDEEKLRVKVIDVDARIDILISRLKSIPQNDYENLINLRGRIINLYKKKENLVTNKNEKMQVKAVIVQELKEQKKTLTHYKNDQSLKMPISKKLGLNVQTISKSTEIFMREKDIVTKATNTIKQTALGVGGAAAISIGGALLWSKIFNIPFNLATIVQVAPTTAYIALSSLVRNLSTKTEFEMYQYMNSDEFKFLVKNFNEKHDKELKEIGKIMEGKLSNRNKDQLLEINDNLIKKYKYLIDETDIQGLKDTFNLQILDLLRESKDICEEFKEDYEEERSNDKEKYLMINKKLSKINSEIFVLGNSIKDALKTAKDSTIKSAKIIVISKSILAAIAPRMFAFGGIKSLAAPILISAANNIIDIPTYPNKLKFRPSEYEGKVKMKEKQRIQDIIGTNNYARAYA